MSKSYNTDIVKIGAKIRQRNQRMIDDYAKSQQRAALIGTIGNAVSGIATAYGQRQQLQQQQQGNAALLGQLGVQGVTPQMAGNLNSSQLVSAILAKRQQDQQAAATSQYLASQGYDNIPAGVDSSILSAIIRNRSPEKTFKLTPELSKYAGGAESIPSGAAQEVIRGFNNGLLQDKYGEQVYVTTDAAGNQIAVPITKDTAGKAISSGTGLVKGDRANETRKNIAEATIAGRMSVEELQQRSANERNAAMIDSRERVAALANENRMQLKAVEAQIAAGNRDAATWRAREALSMRQKQLENAMNIALVRSDTQLASTGLAFGDETPVVTEAQARLKRRQEGAAAPTQEEAEILSLYDAATDPNEFLSDPDIAAVVKKYRVVK